jgi:hypothetical protein
VNTYNQFLWNLKPFYKYIYYPNEEPKNRQLPEFLIGLNQLHRKEGTTYRIDFWLYVNGYNIRDYILNMAKVAVVTGSSSGIDMKLPFC